MLVLTIVKTVINSSRAYCASRRRPQQAATTAANAVQHNFSLDIALLVMNMSAIICHVFHYIRLYC